MEFKTISEKVAYLKGLMEGLKSDDKVIALMADILGDIANEIEDMQSDMEVVYEALDTFDEDLGELEKDYYDIDDDDCCCGHSHDFDECEYDEEDDDEDEDEDEELFDEEELYEVTCPTCGDTICINEAMIEEGSINCPNCGELLEFDFDDSDIEPDAVEEEEE